MTRRFCAWIFIILLAPAFIPCFASAQPGKAAGSESVAGDWRGSSVCQVKPSGCQDEDSLYHIKPSSQKEGWFSLSADRITDGKIVNMGTVDCSYAAADRTLECALPSGTIRLVLEGSQLQGTMTLPNNTLWRKISLKRVSS